MAKKLKVLFVDEDPDDVQLLSHVLNAAGYELESKRVARATALTRALNLESWDVVLSDFNMPGFSGLDALRITREQAGDVPFIVVSGAIGEELAATLMRAGAHDFVNKQNLARLVPAIERELREVAARRARKAAEAARDASETREAVALEQVEAARELDRLRSLFIHTISHEIRNPLTAIVGYLELLEDSPDEPLSAKQAAMVEQGLKSTKRLQRLVDDLLDYARIEGGLFKMRFAPRDVGALVRDVVDGYKSQADTAGVALAVEVAAGPLEAEIDGRRIEQVITNLVGNALKFSPPGSRVRVRVAPGPEAVSVEVSDEGEGITPEGAARLFRPFSQLEGGQRKGGTGLGLAIAKTIVAAHGGRIGLRDGAGGRGTTFFVELLRRPAPPDRVTIDLGAPAMPER